MKPIQKIVIITYLIRSRSSLESSRKVCGYLDGILVFGLKSFGNIYYLLCQQSRLIKFV